jgi:hypothetical protein
MTAHVLEPSHSWRPNSAKLSQEAYPVWVTTIPLGHRDRRQLPNVRWEGQLSCLPLRPLPPECIPHQHKAALGPWDLTPHKQ